MAIRVTKKINTSAVLARDDDGRELVALGRGIGFIDVGEELDIDRISRTFYDVDERFLAVVGDVDPEVVEFASQFADLASGMFSYELSPNISFILADHISFAIKRAQEHIQVRMPLAFDVAQQHPMEYRIGMLIVERIGQMFDVRLSTDEAAGMAMVFVNNIAGPGRSQTIEDDGDFRSLLERSAVIMEHTMHVAIDRQSFNFARYATHLQYLYRRVNAGDSIESGNAAMYESLAQSYPRAAQCVELIDNAFDRELDHRLTDEEKLYLILHVNRIAATADGGSS